ncbi:MAG: PQQ-like beta-propeller repeat protein [Bryobacterales bacterium]|nr:PQQ-like beta-propeller repeat protein [Bryobacterales bacterium]
MRAFVCWALMAYSLPAAPADWPQFLGPARNATTPSAAAAWGKGAPKTLWKKNVGAGFAGPVVAGGKLILFHRKGGEEIVEAFDALTGRDLWRTPSATTYRDDFGFDEGPRGTPAVADGRVFTFGAEGVLQALDLASGRRLWAVETHKEFGVKKEFFGAACSPLVEGNVVIVHVGGQGAGVVAFDAATGKPVWRATSDEAGYSSPVAATVGGARRILAFTRAGLTGLDPATGNVLFRIPWRSRSHASVNAAAPVVSGSLVFVSASYGTGALLLDAAKTPPGKLWSSDDAMSNHYATSVLRDGYLYGYHGRQEQGPSLRCIELKTGKVMWDEDQFRAGTVLLAGDKLLVMRESGELLLAPAAPGGFRPEARARLLDATVRAYPAYAGGVLYVRNERQLAAFRLAAE